MVSGKGVRGQGSGVRGQGSGRPVQVVVRSSPVRRLIGQGGCVSAGLLWRATVDGCEGVLWKSNR